MRPPLSATPPVSHMVSHKGRPLSIDWSTLSSDNSIQILSLNSVDENPFKSSGQSDALKHKASRSVSGNTSSSTHRVSTLDYERQVDMEQLFWVKREPVEHVWVKRRESNTQAVNKKEQIDTDVHQSTNMKTFVNKKEQTDTNVDQSAIKKEQTDTNVDQSTDIETLVDTNIAADPNVPTTVGVPAPLKASEQKVNESTLSAGSLLAVHDEEADPLKQFPRWLCLSQPGEDKILKRITRSDTDIITHKERKIHHGAKVKRPMSLSSADFKTSCHNTELLRPLRPLENRTKVCSVDRISCTTIRPVVATNAIVESEPSVDHTPGNKLANSDGKHRKEIKSRKKAIKQTEILCLPSLIDVQKSKISNFVKTGLRNMTKSNKESSDVIDADSSISKSPAKWSAQAARRKLRNRLFRKSTDIGGLSDFLRMNERRKTVSEFPSSVTDIKPTDKTPSHDSSTNTHAMKIQKPETEQCRKFESLSAQTFSNSSLSYTPKPWARYLIGNNNDQSICSTNVKFAKCHRKLLFPTNVNKGDIDLSSMETEVNKEELVNESSTSMNDTNDDVTRSELPRKPRLGLLGYSTETMSLSIDQLNMDIETDLKRKVEKANRGSAIKTNGSLMRPRLGSNCKASGPSPKRDSLCETSRSLP